MFKCSRGCDNLSKVLILAYCLASLMCGFMRFSFREVGYLRGGLSQSRADFFYNIIGSSRFNDSFSLTTTVISVSFPYIMLFSSYESFASKF